MVTTYELICQLADIAKEHGDIPVVVKCPSHENHITWMLTPTDLKVEQDASRRLVIQTP